MRKAYLIAISFALSLYACACCAQDQGGYMGQDYVAPAQPPPLGSAGPLAGTVLYGIDVSTYQGTINWDSVKTAKDFAIMRSSYGVGYRDAQLTSNQTGARRVGIMRGYYHFAYPNYGNAAVDEADWMLSQIGTLQAGEVLCLDYEVSYSDPVGWCKTFLDRIYSRTGVKPFIYINLSTLNGNNWSPVKNAGYPLWLAYPDGNSNPAVPSTSWGFTTMKQYSWTGVVPGISGDCDLDVFNGDASAFLAYGGLTDTTAPVISSVQATNITSGGATITWMTDDASTSRVDYGLTSSYGSGTTEDTNLLTGHSVVVSGLSSGTPYHYRVKSTNAAGLTSYSGDYTFTTGSMPCGCPLNGDFESGFSGSSPTQIGTGWAKLADDGTSTYTQDTSTKHAGTSSQKIVDPSGGQGYTGYVYQPISVVPNRQYVARFYSYRATGGFVVGMGVDVNGGTTFASVGESSGPSGSWVLKETGSPFTSGAGGVITLAYHGGYNSSQSTGWIDDISIAPAKPSTTGGSTTICAGQSTNITASGGFGGSSSELHWYTGANGTGTHVGAGTTLSVSPTTTTTYYPRWEAASGCGCNISGDGVAVTVTINPPPTAVTVTDEGSYTPSLDTLKASWTQSSSSCGIDRYEYAVGTGSSAQNIRGWTSNGTSTSVTMSGLSLVEGTTYYVQARAIDSYGNASAASAANGILAAPGVNPISAAWARANDTEPLSLRNKIVTARIGNAFWLEETSRACAIKVIAGSSDAAQGNTVSVAGVLHNDGVQRHLVGDVVINSYGNTATLPLGMPGASLGGGSYNALTPGVSGVPGQYNIGLLVRCWGSVTYSNTDDANNKYFYLDDGSGLASGGHAGVKVWCGTVAPPASGTVVVNGIVSSELIGGSVVPVVLVRDGTEIQPL